jgi:hypothetical protein
MPKSAGFKGWVWGPAVMVLLLLSAVRPLCGQVVHATTVTNTSDSGPGSLRAAIASAQNGYIINFNLTFPATILLKTPLTLGPSVTIAGPGASSLAISGGNGVGVFIINAGATVAISGLTIEQGSSLLGGGIFNGGTLTLTNVTVSNNTQGTQLGGGIFNSGTLTLSSSTVSGNSAGFGVASEALIETISITSDVVTAVVNSLTNLEKGTQIYVSGVANSQFNGVFTISAPPRAKLGGGGVITWAQTAADASSSGGEIVPFRSGETGFGGGIYNYGEAGGGRLTLTHSTVSNNSVNQGLAGSANGGGIYNDQGIVTLTDSTVTSNTTPGLGFGFGGGIYDSGSLTLTNSTISDDSAPGGGGGIYVNSGTVTVSNSTVSGNSSNSTGGGSIGGAAGGGIYINSGAVTVTNSTFAGNSTSGDGGAIFVLPRSGTSLSVTFSTIWNNQGSAGIFGVNALNVKNSILANNSAGNNCSPGAGKSDGHNLSDDGTCSFLTGPGDLNKIPAGLDPGGLNNNGGPTQTVALLATSPAVNAIPLSPTNYCTDVNGNPVTTDQRGVPRPQGSGCDIGAYELESVPAQVSATE